MHLRILSGIEHNTYIVFLKTTMGLFVSKLLSIFESFQDNPARVLMLGIDAAGIK